MYHTSPSITKFLFFTTLLLALSTILRAQPATGTIQGSVKTNDKIAAADVSVIIKNTKSGTVTDNNGFFEFHRLRPGVYVLEISLTGYETVEKTVRVEAGQTASLSFQLTLSNKELQEVIIIGNKNKFIQRSSDYVAKVPLNRMENPQVYTTLTKQLLSDQMLFTADDAVKNAPGLQKMWEATGRSGDGGAYYNARGFILQSQLRNGIAGNVTTQIDAANIENMEVIKGPSATLFGSTLTSYGGLINIVTKKPYDTYGGELQYAGGSYNFNRISADINAPLDSAKTILLRVNASYHYMGSFQDNGFDKGYFLAPSLAYRVNDRLAFSFDAEMYGGSNSSKPIIFFYYPADQLGAHTPNELGVDYKRSYSSGDIFQVSRVNNYFLQMDFRLSANWRSQTDFSSTHSFSDGPSAYFYIVPNSVYTGDATATGADYMARADQSTRANDVQVYEGQQNFVGDFRIGSLRNRFVGGLDLFSQNSNQDFYGVDPFDVIQFKLKDIPGYENFNADKLDSALQAGQAWDYQYRYKTQTYSAYVSDVLNVTRNFIVLGSLRADHFKNIGDFNLASNSYTGSYQQTSFSPKFGLVYQPLEDKISVFANYQNGFTNQTGADFEGRAFKPEHANQVETGVRLNLVNGKLSSTLSYYNIQVEDILRTDMAHPLYSVQDGTQLSKGFEAEVIANPFAGLNLMAGFSYNDSKYTRSDEDVWGRRPATAMSPYTANLWLSYRITNGRAQGLGFGFGGNYASDNKIENSVYYGVFTLPAYTVLNATAFYETKKIRLGVKVDNLTNKHYWIGYSTMNPQPLRSFTGSIAFKFR
jgi:iron complex outermembrane receptor protein